MSETKRCARVAGVLYFLIGLLGPYVLLYVPGRIIVSGDAAATANHLRALEPLMRWGIAGDFVSDIVLVFLVLALYKLFKGVSQDLALQLALFGAVISVPIMFVNTMFELGALSIAKGGAFVAAFDPAQRDALAYVFMRLHGQGIVAVEMFWGIWLIPFGILVIRSRFIPWIIGALMLIAGAGYIVASFTGIIAPPYAEAVGRVTEITNIGELPIILWLLIVGAWEPRSAVAASVSAARP